MLENKLKNREELVSEIHKFLEYGIPILMRSDFDTLNFLLTNLNEQSVTISALNYYNNALNEIVLKITVGDNKFPERRKKFVDSFTEEKQESLRKILKWFYLSKRYNRDEAIIARRITIEINSEGIPRESTYQDFIRTFKEINEIFEGSPKFEKFEICRLKASNFSNSVIHSFNNQAVKSFIYQRYGEFERTKRGDVLGIVLKNNIEEKSANIKGGRAVKVLILAGGIDKIILHEKYLRKFKYSKQDLKKIRLAKLARKKEIEKNGKV